MLNNDLFHEATALAEEIKDLTQITDFLRTKVFAGRKGNQSLISYSPEESLSLESQIKKRLDIFDTLEKSDDYKHYKEVFNHIIKEAKDNSYMCPLSDWFFSTPVKIKLLDEKKTTVNGFAIYEQSEIEQWIHQQKYQDVTDPLTRKPIQLEFLDQDKKILKFEILTDLQKSIINFLDEAIKFFEFIKAYEGCCSYKKNKNKTKQQTNYEQALLIAASANSTNTVKKILKLKPNTQCLSVGNRYSPLHHAVRYSNAEMVRALCEAGAGARFIVDIENQTPLQMAAEAGKWDLVKIFAQFEGVNENWETALMLANHADKNDIVKSLLDMLPKGDEKLKNYICGFRSQNGIDTKQDSNLSIQHFKIAADLGHSKSQFHFAIHCYSSSKKNTKLALKYFHAAAEQGHPGAKCMLGTFYENGECDVEKNLIKAFEYYKSAAELGAQQAQFNLGTYYRLGLGGKVNYELATHFLKLAADQGDMRAQFDLAWNYAEGMGGKKNCSKAVEYFQLSANQGYASSQNKLGAIYRFGLFGVAPNLEKAISCYKLAGIYGDAQGKNNLGECYFNGEGVAKDLAMAVKLFTESANQFCAEGQTNLGICYLEGKGVTKNPSLAVNCFQKAAKQKDPKAQFYLAHCLYYGQGIAKDLSQASEYFKLAAAQGYEKAINALQELNINRDEKPEDLRTLNVEEKEKQQDLGQLAQNPNGMFAQKKNKPQLQKEEPQVAPKKLANRNAS